MLPSSPQEFGKYMLRRQIGRGGMADVYEAELLAESGISGVSGVSKRVALKLLLPGLKHKEHVIRSFVDEATIAARLSHPNIVQVFDFGEIDGTLYMAMEYVEGCDLRELIDRLDHKKDRMPVGATIYVVHELALALDYIHTLNDPVVHRDVTPHNVFVTRDGHVKLGDFGIAKWATREGYTETGQIKGKLSYLSPEQVTGDPVTPRTDIYAAGLILFELATGRRLLSGASEVELIQNARSPALVLPSSLNPDAAVLDELVLRTLKPHPTMRLPSAALLLERLQVLLQLRPFDAQALSQLVVELEQQKTKELPVSSHIGSQTDAVTRPHVSDLHAGGDSTATQPLPDGERLEAATEPTRGLRPGRLLLVLGLCVVALFFILWQVQLRLISSSADPEQLPDLQIQLSAVQADAERDEPDLAHPVEAPHDASTTAQLEIEVDARLAASAPATKRRSSGRKRPRPRRPPRRPARSSPVKRPPPKPAAAPAPPPAAQTAALRRRLTQISKRARAKGLFPGDDRAYDRTLSALHRAVGRDDGEAKRRLQELEQQVESFRIDRRFANQKLARLEQAIARAKLSDKDRKQLTAGAQRILRLIINDRLREASTLITTQMRLLARKSKGK